MDVIIGHILDISLGRCSITEEMVLASPGGMDSEILAGLLAMHETIAFQKSELSRLVEQERNLVATEKAHALELLEVNQQLEAGQATRLAILRDLQKKNEALDGANAYVNNILKSITEIVMVVQPEGVIGSINPAVQGLLGYKQEELLGKAVSTILEGDLMCQTGGAGITQVERTFLHKSGEKIPVLFSGSVMRDNANKVIGTVCVAANLKERKKADEERQEMQAQLYQAAKLTSLGELSAGLAHEMKQPLNAIKIINQAVIRDIEKERLDTTALKRSLSEVVTQINKMAEIIDHMRIYTRKTIGDGRQHIAVNDCVESVSRFLAGQFHSSDIAVVSELAGGLPPVSQDPVQLEQVLLNILTNARHALMDAKVDNKKVEILTYLMHADASPIGKETVVIEIRDNGGGILPALESRIFEAFFTTKEAGKGTGLGLSISRKIVKERGGDLLLANRFGVGAAFKILLVADV